MAERWGLLPGWLGLLLAASPASSDVVPPDTRRPPTAEEAAGLSALGVVYPDGSLGGTAFLVGACDVLVTAKHTILDSRERPRSERFRYYPLNGERGIEALLDGSIVGRGGGEADDWIVMRLAEADADCIPMTPWAVSDPELATLAEGFDTAGFHADLRGALMVSQGCAIAPECRAAAQLREVFTHDCDTDVGASGSPVYVRTEIGQAVFGLHIRGHGPGADICSRSNLARRISGALHAAILEMLAQVASPGPRRHHDDEGR